MEPSREHEGEPEVGNAAPPVDGPGVGELERRALLSRLIAMGATSLAAAMGGAAMAALSAAPAAADTAASGEPPAGAGPRRRFRYGMVIDTRRCVGCKACVVACKAENKTPPGVSYTVVLDGVLGNRVDDKPLFMTKPCFHCEDPPCVDVCPVGATFKREQDGIVVVDYDRCIGCRYCITGCPYGARYFDYGDNYRQVADGTPYASVPSPEYNQFRSREKGQSPIGNVRKCTFCVHLQDAGGRYDRHAGRWPACAVTCTGHAIHFGDFNDQESDVSRLLRERQAVRLKEELGTNPNVYYLL
jgi:molybdopterin-containing oxidoreductase family iron-sulfur binding subunit